MTGAGAMPAVTLAEAPGCVRIDSGEEEAIIAGLSTRTPPVGKSGPCTFSIRAA